MSHCVSHLRAAVLCVSMLATCNVATAQDLSCNDVAALAGMARSKTVVSLKQWKLKATESEQARLVYAVRLFELNPRSRVAALALLAFIPTTQPKQDAWYSLSGLLCQDETDAQLSVLAPIPSRLPRELAKAALLAPQKMYSYIAYAAAALNDPHSDYAVQMQSVCRRQHAAFMNVWKAMPPESQRWYTTKILNPETCRAIAVPEAE